MPVSTDLRSLVAQPGASTLDYYDEAFPGRRLRLHAARPVTWHPGVPVLFVHHGVARNGGDYRDYWQPHATDVLVVSIEFPEESFPEYLCYNFGNLHAADGTPRPRESWTYGIGPRLFDRLLAQGVTTAPRHGLFGHSAGGQYVHRMLSFGYRDRVGVAVTANAGTYAMPDLSIAWPWGLGAVACDDLREILAFPLTVMAGTEDTKVTGRFFPGGPKSMRQGANRFERARAYVRMGQQAAALLGMACAWRLIEVPGVGHDGHRMSNAAVDIVRHALVGQRLSVSCNAET